MLTTNVYFYLENKMVDDYYKLCFVSFIFLFLISSISKEYVALIWEKFLDHQYEPHFYPISTLHILTVNKI